MLHFDIVLSCPIVFLSAGFRQLISVKIEKMKTDKKQPRNLIKEEAEYFSREYTNEHIRKQIAENSVLFKDIVLILSIALLLISISIIRSFIDIYPDISLGSFFRCLINNHPIGLTFGITLIIMASPAIKDADSFCMLKHIHPVCSSKRYDAKEIDNMANDPKTVWLRELEVFATPTTLIGINKGLTVIDYDDIADIWTKTKEHSENISTHKRSGRMNGWIALYRVLTDHYQYWNTCLVMIKTKRNRRILLTETSDSGIKELIPIIREKCGISFDLNK